ncbi:hypothetical protein N7527_011276 [Penicillium freii]|uniref:Uncharacterized protein n=1 Tax=Penicillium freii TaxID=48697 RepID=A0A101M8Y5_PENFR|nr:hypothetical protein N7527_011276 [Penicillium freii]KUM56221.1 hypothetical protein ACN42_g10998 [Penicillium freii]
MDSNQPSPTLTWHSKLHRMGRLVKLCIATENFGPLNAILANYVTHETDHVTVVQQHAEGPDALAQLKQVSLQQIHDLECSFRSDLHDLGCALDKAGKDRERTREAFHKFSNSRKTQVDKSWDKATEAAEKIIDKLPEDAQDPATDIFGAAGGAVSNFMGHQLKAAREIAQLLGRDEVKDAIHDAEVTNQTAAEVTGAWIHSLYERGSKGKAFDGDFPAPAESYQHLEPMAGDRLSLRKTAAGWQIYDCA